VLEPVRDVIDATTLELADQAGPLPAVASMAYTFLSLPM
jgi:hypothetical protein